MHASCEPYQPNNELICILDVLIMTSQDVAVHVTAIRLADSDYYEQALQVPLLWNDVIQPSAGPNIP